MALKIVTGGTTGAADGTLVSGGNPIVFTAVDVPVDVHIRMDDDTYAAPAQFVAATTAGPAVGEGDIQISVNGGSTWKSWADNPYSIATGQGAGPDLGDLNFPIKLRQHAASSPGDTSGSFDTDGTFASATALADVTSFVVTPGDTQNALSWAAVTNRTAYRIDRATDSGFTTGVALDLSPGLTATSYTDTGRTNGTTYYYRIKAVGTYRFKDSASYATGNGAPTSVYHDDLFTDTDGVAISSHTPVGAVGGGSWTKMYDGGTTAANLFVKSNRVLTCVPTGGPLALTVEAWQSGSSNANCAAEVDAYVYSTASGAAIMVACRVSGASFAARNCYRLVLANDGTLTLGKIVAGSYTSLGTYAVGTLTVGQTYTIRVEAIGTAVKAYVDGVQRISVTDSSVSAGGQLSLFVSNPAAVVYSGTAAGFGADAVRLYNT